LIQRQGTDAKRRISLAKAKARKEKSNVVIEEWDYELLPVYSINVCNFNLNRDAGFMDVFLLVSGIDASMYGKLKLFCFDLTKVIMKPTARTSRMEWWLYIIKNMHKFKEPLELASVPEELRDIFDTLFYVDAPVENLTQTDKKKYNDSLKYNLEMNELKAKIVALNKDNAALNRDNAALSRELEAYRKKYGDIKGSGSSPSKSGSNGSSRSSQKQSIRLPQGWYYDDNGRLRDDRGLYAKL
jgi:hypothetical protein